MSRIIYFLQTRVIEFLFCPYTPQHIVQQFISFYTEVFLKSSWKYEWYTGHQAYVHLELGLYLTIETTEAYICTRKHNSRCPLAETLLELRVTTETSEHWQAW